MSQLDLRPQDLQRVLAIAREHLPKATELWAYGSRIKGLSHAGSDLDLVLRSQNLAPLPPQNLSAFKEALHDSNIPIFVQALDWARLPAHFHTEILKEHIILNEQAL